MQRYSAPSCGGGFTNTAVGGASVRDNVRGDSSFSASNYPLNSRRPSQLAPYKLKCEKEPLNCRLGPPDFYPQAPNCPEETLTREYLISGYKETVEGIEEARETGLSQVALTKPVILKCKEEIRKRLRAINESRAQKRKAGQVYGVPLSGQLLLKPFFPEQRSYGEDCRKKWIEGLSQQHKRLCCFADHVPHGYRKKSLLEVIIRQNVPLLRATWFIKITYLNQVRPNSSGVSSGTPDKIQLNRTESWTRDLIEYLQYLLDDFFAKDGFCPSGHSRDQTSQTLLSGLPQQSTDSDGGEPSLQFKWGYIVRLLQWHYAEGLLFPSLIIEWILNQLQEKESVEALELLLPVIVDLVESVALSQTYVRLFVDIANRSLHSLYPGGMEFLANVEKPHIASALIEVLRYLLLAVPDTFVGLDCFPLPCSVAPDLVNGKSAPPMLPELEDKTYHGSQDAYHRYLSFGHVAASLRIRASNLAKIANPNLQGHGVAKVVQALDKALIQGDVRGAYSCLFEELSDTAIEECWIAEVNSGLRSSLKWIGTVDLSVICAVFFLCEWATCDFRDFRTSLPPNVKFTGRKDFCQVYLAVLLLKLRMEDMQSMFQSKKGSSSVLGTLAKTASQQNGLSSGTAENVFVPRGCSKIWNSSTSLDILQSPGPLHDIVVCWLDQHEVGKGEGFKRLQVLILELIRHGIFYPQAYVRQLIVSGTMDKAETALDSDRQRRHHRVLKQLPGTYLFDALEESKIAEVELLREAVHVYSNERNLVLHGLFSGHSIHLKSGASVPSSFGTEKLKDSSAVSRDGASPSLLDNRENRGISSSYLISKQVKSKSQVARLKVAISSLLHFPHSCCSTTETQLEESQGILKRAFGSVGSILDSTEATADCEECTRTKRQRLNNERFSNFQGLPSNNSDDEDTWWVRKGPKSLEAFKAEQPFKPTKHASRGRQKSVRKTQSLAQLAAARIESSQGASTSHVCENKVSCPHHKSGIEGESPKSVDGMAATRLSDIGRSLKKLRWLEKRSISIWLLTSIRLLVEGNDKSGSKVTQCSGPFSSPTEEKSVVRWKLGEDELSSILYLLDISSDLYLVVKFLLWLLPKIHNGTSDVHIGRNPMIPPRNKENHVFKIGEPFLLSALNRYENVLVATDLLPEALSAAMHRAVTTISSNGRASSSFSLIYSRNLLKKYGNVTNVAKWEKGFRATCDPRFLAELDAGRSLDSDVGCSSASPAGVEDLDDFFRQKISGRIPRSGPIMKDIVQRNVEEAVLHFYGKERKLFTGTTNMKLPSLEKWDDGYQLAQQIVLALLDCIRQNSGASQESDPSLVAAAVSAIVGNVGTAIAKLPDYTSSNNYQTFSSAASSLTCVRGIVNIHIACLYLLKEAVGERLGRVLEIALAAEASSNISGAFAPGKFPRGQFQLSPETHDINPNISNDILNNSTKTFSSRSSKISAAVSALIVGAIVHGVSTLERMITVFKLKEGLDILQFIRNARSNSNGISRSIGNFKSDHCIEIYVHWFRLLIGDCRSVFDGLVVDILGESYALALSRMQRMVPLNLAFPPAYSIFAMVIWRHYILNNNIATRDDVQLYQYLSAAIGDVIRHQPFRDLCLRDSRALYDLMSSDGSESEFGAILELHSPDKHIKTMAFVPLRARLFLNALVDSAMPSFTITRDDNSLVSGHGEARHAENETKLLDQLVHVLDTLQPAKFHWQWIELRLLLNEQALIEKIENHSMSLVDALRSLSPAAENDALSENENAFTEIVLTRLLVRPDAASLYSEVFHLLGRSLEERLLLHAKWFLQGNDVLLGRKSIRQRLINVAQHRGLSTKAQCWKPWGWSGSIADASANRVEKRKLEASTLEEGEVVEEGMDAKRSGKSALQVSDGVGYNTSQQCLTDKALAELVLPCIDSSSSEARTAFATEIIKQMNNIYQHINATRGASKQSAASPSGVDGSANKGSNRKGIRGGSPGLGRRPTGSKDSAPPSAAALKASIWLRLQFLLRLLPIIYPDRESSSRNLKNMLATILLRLLGTQVVYEDADVSYLSLQRTSPKKELELLVETSFCPSLDLSGESLFDMILSVLHGLLSGCKPSWLKPRSASKPTIKSSRDFTVFDREIAASLQAELDRMQLPATVRRCLQAAMPMLPPPPCFFVSCHPPLVSSASLSSLQPISLAPGLHQANTVQPQRTVPSARPVANASSRSKLLLSQDPDMEVDPWTLLEDGTGSASASSNNSSMGTVSGDHSNLKGCCWLKGTVRVRRTDLTYIGAIDDDS